MDWNIGRMARWMASGGLLSLGAWLAVPPLLHTTSIDAVVNGRIVVLRSPIEGKVEDGSVRVGERVVRGQALVAVANDRLNNSFAGELRTEKASLEQRIAALDTQAAELRAMRDDLDKRTDAYGASTTQRVSGRLSEAEASLRSARAQAQEASARAWRNRALLDKGYISTARIEESDAAERRSQEEVRRASAVVAQLQDELKSIKAGVFLGEGQNDVPYSRQRRDEITLRLQDLAARRNEYATRVGAIDAQIAGEANRIAHQSRFVQPSPISGVVWRNHAAPETDVVIGTELLEVLDCSNLFLDVAVSERLFDEIKPGNAVDVRLIGSDQTVTGTVQSVRGPAAIIEDRFLAARMRDRKEHDIQVIVSLPANLGANSANFCQVGRSAKVVFSSTPVPPRQETADAR